MDVYENMKIKYGDSVGRVVYVWQTKLKLSVEFDGRIRRRTFTKRKNGDWYPMGLREKYSGKLECVADNGGTG